MAEFGKFIANGKEYASWATKAVVNAARDAIANLLSALSDKVDTRATPKDVSNGASTVIQALPTDYATEDTLSQQAQAIKNKIDNIDLSEVAKQGDNPNATNSAILEAMPTVVTPPVTDAEFTEFEQHMSNDIYI